MRGDIRPLIKAMEASTNSGSSYQDMTNVYLQYGWSIKQTEDARLNIGFSKSSEGHSAQLILKRLSISSIIVWCVALFLPAWVVAGYDIFELGENAMSGGFAFGLGFMFFWLYPAWFANIPALMLMRRSVMSSFRSLATSYKAATIWGWCSILAALSIIFYPQKLNVRSENDYDFANVGFGGYMWIASVITITIAYTLAYMKYRKYLRRIRNNNPVSS